MEGSQIYLLGIDSPSNIERVLTDIKRTLFYDHGIVSGLALGPVIPLAFRAAEIAAPDPTVLPRCGPLSTGEWAVLNDTLFLSVLPRSELSSLLVPFVESSPEPEDSRGNPASPSPVPIPTYPGLYIARLVEPPPPRMWPHGEAPPLQAPPADPERILSFLGAPPRLNWSVSRLSCRLLRYELPLRWWNAIVCEDRWSTRLRKPSDGS
jgi:hypothetical protein